VKINVLINCGKSLINGKTKANIKLITGYTNNQLISINFHFLGLILFASMLICLKQLKSIIVRLFEKNQP